MCSLLQLVFISIIKNIAQQNYNMSQEEINNLINQDNNTILTAYQHDGVFTNVKEAEFFNLLNNVHLIVSLNYILIF